MEYKTFLPITCVHGDTRQVPAHRVTISAVTGTWPVEVGVVKDLPVPVLIGRDWPGFDRLLATTTQPASPRRDRRRRKPTKGPRQHTPFCGPRIAGPDKLSLASSLPAFRHPKRPALLVRSAKGGGKIIVGGCPAPRRRTVLELAHSHPLAGHLGATNTSQRSATRFHWPGLESWGEEVLPSLPDLPSYVTQDNLPPARWYHSPSSRCLLSASGWTW